MSQEKNEDPCFSLIGRPLEICRGINISPAKRAAYLARWGLTVTDIGSENAKPQNKDQKQLKRRDPRGPCGRRGEVLRESTCELCGSRGELYLVYACPLHVECSEVRRSQTLPACLGCKDWIPQK